MSYPDREFTEFLDRMRGRFRMDRPNRWLSNNRHIETPAQTWRRRYDAETERLREYMRIQMERKAG